KWESAMNKFTTVIIAAALAGVPASPAPAGLPFEPATLTEYFTGETQPFVVLADFDTGFIVYRNVTGFAAATQVFIRHLESPAPTAAWGVGSLLSDGSVVASL